MRILFIGGTGNLSWDTSLQVLAMGHDLYHLNRGLREGKRADGITTLTADINDENAATAALGSRTFDCLVAHYHHAGFN
jgi:nucleoside-diphosphate-sugar epimerase